MSQIENLAAFPDIPIDIATHILEIAAGDDIDTALILTEVSKEVQEAVDKVMFCHISIRTTGDLHLRTKMLKTLISPTCCSRWLRARQFIRTIWSHETLGYRMMIPLLDVCPNIVSLGTFELNHRFYDLYHPGLRRLYFRRSVLPTRICEPLTEPFFQNITHLAFLSFIFGYRDEEIGMNGSLLALSSLTHLCVKDLVHESTSGKRTWTTNISKTVLPNLPKQLQVVMVLLEVALQNPWERYGPPHNIHIDQDLPELQHGQYDKRLVVLPSTGFIRDRACDGVLHFPTDTPWWEDWMDKAWEEAEKIVQSRVL
ncbi:hypothetical protein DL96DRAFT_1683990 [Flagelloscypha sp. PMI_526]|nr:hypothetical protein DL96DRAFT_1683990 [Flagelloscypha sp. PMI_526]